MTVQEDLFEYMSSQITSRLLLRHDVCMGWYSFAIDISQTIRVDIKQHTCTCVPFLCLLLVDDPGRNPQGQHVV